MADLEPKRPVKGAPHPLRGGWVDAWRDRARESGVADTGRLSVFRMLQQSFLKARENSRAARKTPPQEIDVLRGDFRVTMAVWGLEESERETVAKNLRLEAYLMAFVAIFTVVGLYSDLRAWQYWVSAVVVVPATVGLALMRFWRSEVLLHRQFTPFVEWLFKGRKT